VPNSVVTIDADLPAGERALVHPGKISLFLVHQGLRTMTSEPSANPAARRVNSE
jgi:hypothetical protein